MTLPVWVDGYRDKPYLRRGEGPAGYDCYGLVRAVLRDRWGAEIAPLTEARDVSLGSALEHGFDDDVASWAPVAGDPAPGDVLLFEARGIPYDVHIGIIVADGWMLHVQEREGVLASRYERPRWAALRIGPPFRHRALCEQAGTVAP